MSKLVENLRNIFKIEELRDRDLFTIALLAVVRIGAHITLPGVDASLLAEVIRSQSLNSLFALYDLFAGGAFQNAAVIALGILPYISAAIILQLLGAVVPYFRKLLQEGEEGRRKLEQYARQGTVLIAALQTWGVSINGDELLAIVNSKCKTDEIRFYSTIACPCLYIFFLTCLQHFLNLQ